VPYRDHPPHRGSSHQYTATVHDRHAAPRLCLGSWLWVSQATQERHTHPTYAVGNWNTTVTETFRRSLVAQGVDGVLVGSLVGGVEAEDEAGHG